MRLCSDFDAISISISISISIAIAIAQRAQCDAISMRLRLRSECSDYSAYVQRFRCDFDAIAQRVQ
jgi:hypothetical protein